MSIEIIVYSCLSFVSLSLAIGYIIKCRVNDSTDDAVSIETSKPKHPTTKEQAIEIIIQQEIIAAL